VFGFDILLDKDYKAWVLEINDHPSFNIHYCKEFMNTKVGEEVLSQVDL
jgi:D-alanine-D-alanine ligase-like ATP-grasp enzyme